MKEDNSANDSTMRLEAYARSVVRFRQQMAESSSAGSSNEGGRDQQAQQDIQNSDNSITVSEETRQQICNLIQAALDLYDETEEDLVEADTSEKTTLYSGRQTSQ